MESRRRSDRARLPALANSNALFARPDLKSLPQGIRFVSAQDDPIGRRA